MPFAVSDMTRQGTSNGVVATAAAAAVGTVVIVINTWFLEILEILETQTHSSSWSHDGAPW